MYVCMCCVTDGIMFVVSGMVVFSVLEHSGYYRRSVMRSIAIRGLPTYSGNIIGGITLGLGMVISGACPGTVLAQIGTGNIDS